MLECFWLIFVFTWWINNCTFNMDQSEKEVKAAAGDVIENRSMCGQTMWRWCIIKIFSTVWIISTNSYLNIKHGSEMEVKAARCYRKWEHVRTVKLEMETMAGGANWSDAYHTRTIHSKHTRRFCILYFTYRTTLHSKYTTRFCILCFAYGSTENTLEYRRVQYRLCFSVFWHYNTEEYRRAPCLHRVQYVHGATQRVE